MSEYQEAILYFKNLIDLLREANKHLYEDELDLLQEEFFHNLNLFRFLLIDVENKKGRDIPKKPIYLNKCAKCENHIHKNDKYCSHCGQKLDWRKDE